MATLVEERTQGANQEQVRPAARTVMRQVEKIVARPDAKGMYAWAVLRIGIGWIFLWAFVDKLFGLGFATEADSAWLAGGSPTFGFLNFATKGPFAGFYQAMAGNAVVDWLFMLGLLFLGVTLMTGVMVRVGAFAGVGMLGLMYTAGFILPEHNLFLDEHIVYAVILVGLALTDAGRYLGLGRPWARIPLVERFPVLR